MSTQAQAAEARRLAVAAMVTVLDGRYGDLPSLLADAERIRTELSGCAG